ncbi:hypothetical protein ACIQCR_17265 [Streptomyces sp. NPDC093249]|uniref:hypothetical protein n=1 Tax=unclassified Streptomyces TaxID=2593676 RepID=UPI00344E8B26
MIASVRSGCCGSASGACREDRHARRSSIWRRDADGQFRLYYQATPVPDRTAQL